MTSASSPVVIVTDSTAALPEPVSGHGALRVLRVGIVADGQRIPDGQQAAPAVHRALAAGRPVRTVSPSPVDYLQVVETAGAGGVVIVTPATELAVMHRNAVLAARLADAPVVVVDARTAAAAHGLVVAAGLQAVDTGADLDGVASAARRAAGHARLAAVVPRRRHVPGGAGALATQLVELRDGVIVPVDTTAGDDPIATLATMWRSGQPATGERPVVFHDGNLRVAEGLRQTIGEDAELCQVGPALAVHLGPGCVGVAWHEQSATARTEGVAP